MCVREKRVCVRESARVRRKTREIDVCRGNIYAPKVDTKLQKAAKEGPKRNARAQHNR